jgi:hypothetical protein
MPNDLEVRTGRLIQFLGQEVIADWRALAFASWFMDGSSRMCGPIVPDF